jgi:hypothetical protein
MKYRRQLAALVIAFAAVWFVPAQAAAVPPANGTPVVDSPQLLDWPRDIENGEPDLTEATANRLSDLHGQFTGCDMAVSTAGNYHMAFRDLWHDVFLPRYASELNLKNWFFVTSPPIAKQQIQNGKVVFGNLSLQCVPQIAVGPLKAINDLKAAGLTTGDAVPVFKNRGNVLLVKKGNPKHIKTVWDLGRPDVQVVTPNPLTEKSTFENYSGSIYDIALNDESNAPSGWNADRLFNLIFNSAAPKVKWLAGSRIHHREVPWSIAYGKADTGVLFYHLALHAIQTFPDLFEIVPLGGTVENPQPLPGNRIGAHYAIRIKGDWTATQGAAAGYFMDALSSSDFTQILERHGLQR